jgi:hypothetical protein
MTLPRFEQMVSTLVSTKSESKDDYIPAGQYIGRLCMKGDHGTLRYTSNGGCVQCALAAARECKRREAKRKGHW